MSENIYWVDVTTTYKVYGAENEEQARNAVERYEDTEDTGSIVVKLKDQVYGVEQDF
jgi:hypothetical protein